MKKISITGARASDALLQIDLLERLSPKNKGCLRLLTEEMFSICRELLDVEKLDFEVTREGLGYALRAVSKTRVDEEAREQFLP